MKDSVLDLAGIGIGPFNLSLAAQLDSLGHLRARFFDQRPEFSWHPGMMLPGAELQTSFLKDLVTATNPTSPWSFLSYLVVHKRFYSFMNADYSAIPRQEFASYLAWVAASLDNLSFGSRVRSLAFERDQFVLRFDNGRVATRNVALGIGLSPFVPAWAQRFPDQTCFHASETTRRLQSIEAKRVTVIGGGQSGAEIVLALLSRDRPPEQLHWISRRPNFEPLDATAFTNELFTPGSVTSFHGMGEERRLAALGRHKLAGDGASPSTLLAIYRRLYALRYLDRVDNAVALMPHRDVIQADHQNAEYRLMMRNGFDGGLEFVHADAIILATGYVFKVPDFLDGLDHRIAYDSRRNFKLAHDFSLIWDGPGDNRIFALNAGRHSHGIAEPQLSLMAWRSAVIANAILGRAHFDTDLPDPVVQWESFSGNDRSGSRWVMSG